MRIQMLRVCIGPFCNGRVFGCSINGTKSKCATCEHSHGGQCQIKATTGNFTHSFCGKCIDRLIKERRLKNDHSNDCMS